MLVESTPLGHRVTLTRDRWREILRFKHPALAGYEAEVQACLRDPERVRASAKDADVHLYYRTSTRGYVCVVVGGDKPAERFVITAYFTKDIKKGQDLWTK
jgi:hypothetical protein